MTVTRDGVVGLAIDITPLGRGLAILPFVFALGGMLAFGLEAVRSHTRRTTAVLYLLLGVIGLPAHSLLRNMWLDGVTPVNLTPLGLSGSMLVLATSRSTRGIVCAIFRRRSSSITCAPPRARRRRRPRGDCKRERERRLRRSGDGAGKPARARSHRLRPGRRANGNRCGIWHGEAARHRRHPDRDPRPNGSVLVRALVLEDGTAYREARDGLHALTDELLQQAAELEE